MWRVGIIDVHQGQEIPPDGGKQPLTIQIPYGVCEYARTYSGASGPKWVTHCHLALAQLTGSNSNHKTFLVLKYWQ